jgi:hypothetical protein
MSNILDSFFTASATTNGGSRSASHPIISMNNRSLRRGGGFGPIISGSKITVTNLCNC